MGVPISDIGLSNTGLGIERGVGSQPSLMADHLQPPNELTISLKLPKKNRALMIQFRWGTARTLEKMLANSALFTASTIRQCT